MALSKTYNSASSKSTPRWATLLWNVSRPSYRWPILNDPKTGIRLKRRLLKFWEIRTWVMFSQNRPNRLATSASINWFQRARALTRSTIHCYHWLSCRTSWWSSGWQWRCCRTMSRLLINCWEFTRKQYPLMTTFTWDVCYGGRDLEGLTARALLIYCP